jgi:signal transduction histidine kinase/ligand-binding sensor domain-containing protein/DNA-binding response OmpR family regulator
MFPVNIPVHSHTFKHLGIENGLSNNYVLDIVQDGQGLIWIATESGLNRFDGKTFTVYNKNNSTIVGDELNALLYDREENTLWIGSQRDGISVFNCTTDDFHNYTMENGLETNDVTHLSHASDSGIWITHYHVGIAHYNKKTKRFKLFSDKDNVKELKPPNWCAAEDSNGNLYVGHAFDGMSIINLKDNTVRNYRSDAANPGSIPGNTVYSICIDRQQNVWVGTNQGLALFYPHSERFVCFKHEPGNPHSLISNSVHSVREMNDGTLWIGTNIGGVSILDLYNITFMNPEKVKFRNITGNREGPSGNTRSLLQDSFGNIWIGNYGSGVNFISHSQPLFKTLPCTAEKSDNTKNKPAWSLFVDEKEQIWVGGENEITVFKDGKQVAHYDISSCQPNIYTQIFDITCDKNGIFRFGLCGGLLNFNPETRQFQYAGLDIESTDAVTFFEDTDGKMLVGTWRGIFSYQNNRFKNEEQINSQLSDKSVYSILRDWQGKLWVGTFGKGIFVFDADNRLVSHSEVNDGFCSNAVFHLYQDSKGGIWAATRNGIAYIKDTGHPDRFELYGAKNGLKENHVRAVQEDKAGNIWVSTNTGISFWDKEKQRFDNYDYHDGISVGNFIEGSACFTADGTVYFGSLSGVSYFDPKELAVEHPVSPVQIIDCKGFDKQIENRSGEYIIPLIKGNVNLSYDRNTFRVSFAVPDYSQNNQVEYAYQMKGLEDGWRHTQGENQITFRNLPPGEYLFRVKAKLKNHEWDDNQIASMAVHIHPPLWLTWYAKLIYLLVTCAGGFYLLKLYKNRLKLKASLELERKNSQSKQELNDERLRFYTNITHELRTPLTLILGPLEDLVDASDIPASHQNKIQTIHGSAIRLLNLINKILEFRKTETQNRKLTVQKDDLGCLIKETGLRYKELNRNEKTDFHIRIETADTVLYYDEDMITIILDNLLSNAAKYTPEGEICLVLRSVEEADNRYTEIEVSDTGYGIDKETLPHIFDRYYQAKGKHQASGTGIGLALVKSLVELHEGILTVESDPGKGSIFRFRLLTGNTYPGALHADSKPEQKRKETVDIPGEPESSTLPTVLVIEDSNEIRDYIASSLSPGYNVYTATNGREGLKLAQKKMPDIIVSDIMMPEMDGLELCRMMKGDIRTSHIPVILLTAKDSIRDKKEGYESGADSYLTKPFSAKLLISRIYNLLEDRKRLAGQVIARVKGVKPQTACKTQNTLPISRIDEEFLVKITTLIEENRNMENLDISFLRKKVNMSHATFYRKIKALTGITASEFVRKIKMKSSLKLLLTGSYNVSETAYMIGFSDVSYFSRCFKEEYGMLPSEYIRKVKTDKKEE